jgi:hypothetical protein
MFQCLIYHLRCLAAAALTINRYFGLLALHSNNRTRSAPLRHAEAPYGTEDMPTEHACVIFFSKLAKLREEMQVQTSENRPLFAPSSRIHART